jgi:poly(3-hydroxybutyrate) depolymerase
MDSRRLLRHWLVVGVIVAVLLSSCGLRQRRGQGAVTDVPAGPTAAATALPIATDPPAPATATPAPAATEAPSVEPLEYTTGRNDYVMMLEGVPREFIVYVPPSYDAALPAPVVFMFHGSNQSGQLMYESTAWVDKADQEGFLVVFPTS